MVMQHQSLSSASFSVPRKSLRPGLDVCRRSARTSLPEQSGPDVVAAFFAARGGLKSGDEVVALMRKHFDQPISVLAHWIVERKLLSLRLNGQLLIPMFQFDAALMHVRSSIAMTVAELNPRWDDVRSAAWFVSQNPMLDGYIPFALLDAEPAAVLQAALATNFNHG